MLPGPLRGVAVALALVVVPAGVAGCGGDDEAAPEERAALEESLGFLTDELGLTDAEIACTAARIEDQVGGAALERFAETIRRVDAGEVSVDDLPDAESELLTSAIGTCVAGA